MADELNTNAEFNGKHKDEEDPILVAQRYLNIYRQLHIFNDRRRKEYDDDVLKLPSNIKMLLSTIPGGGLLLEHIKEVEEARGISSDAIPQVTFLDQEDISENTAKGKNKNSSKKDSGSAVSADLIKILRQNEEQHNREIKALTEAFIKSQESMTDMLKEILSKPAVVVPAAEPVVQPKPEPAEEPVVAETQNPAKPLDEILPEQDQIQELSIPKEEASSASILGNLAKRFFSARKTEQDTPNIAEPDHTPVSLEDLSDTPVSLDKNNLAEDPQISALLNDVNQEDSSDDSDWEWDYVDDSLPQALQTDSQSSAEDEELEYVEAPQDAENNEEWEYIEAPQDAENNEEWEYVEAPEGGEDNTEWEYVEVPEETAQDLSQPLKDTKE